MTFPSKIQHWLDTGQVPPRLLLSGGNSWDTALALAASLQGEPTEALSKGAHGDTLILRDDGKSFKIDFSESAKRDGQGEFENVRGVVRWISQKPVSPKRIVLMENLERCTRDAPQALLKIIEEPPAQAMFIFTTQNHYQILQTILSRITVVTLPSIIEGELSTEAIRFLESGDLIEQFRMIETLDSTSKKEKDRSLNVKFVNDLIKASQAHENFHPRLDSLLQAHNDLKGNLNPKLVLENLVLGWQ